jgi:hypothetical protein
MFRYSALNFMSLVPTSEVDIIINIIGDRKFESTKIRYTITVLVNMSLKMQYYYLYISAILVSRNQVGWRLKSNLFI